MKKVRTFLFGIFFILFFCLSAQVPPDPPATHGSNTDQQAGGNANLASGVLLLVSLGMIYGARKYYDLRKQ